MKATFTIERLEMKLTYIDSPEDMRWLVETKRLPPLVGGVKPETLACAILEGNEDCPTRITIYSAPDIGSPHWRFRFDAESDSYVSEKEPKQ